MASNNGTAATPRKRETEFDDAAYAELRAWQLLEGEDEPTADDDLDAVEELREALAKQPWTREQLAEIKRQNKKAKEEMEEAFEVN